MSNYPWLASFPLLFILLATILLGNAFGLEDNKQRISPRLPHETFQEDPTPEDPSPLINVSSCGGLIESSSGAIELTLLGPLRKCMILIRSPHNSLRFTFTESNLAAEDTLLSTTLYNGAPLYFAEISGVGRNTTVPGGFVLLTLNLNSSISFSRSFRLEFYSSGYPNTVGLSGFASLDTSFPGLFAYPVGGGNYGRGENAIIILGPSQDSQERTFAFQKMDLQGTHPSCVRDYVRVYTLNNNSRYEEAFRTCDNYRPDPIALQNGIGLVTFLSDWDTVYNSGFDISYL